MQPRSGKPCTYPQSSSCSLSGKSYKQRSIWKASRHIPSNSVVTTSAEVEVEKKGEKKICLSSQEVTHLRFWSLVQLSEIVAGVYKVKAVLLMSCLT